MISLIPNQGQSFGCACAIYYYIFIHVVCKSFDEKVALNLLPPGFNMLANSANPLVLALQKLVIHEFELMVVEDRWPNALSGVHGNSRFMNMTPLCNMLDSYETNIGIDGIMYATYLHWYPSLPGVYHWFPISSSVPIDVSSLSWYQSRIIIAWILILNHFIGAWVFERYPAGKGLELFLRGQYDEAMHGAFTWWGATHSDLAPIQF